MVYICLFIGETSTFSSKFYNYLIFINSKIIKLLKDPIKHNKNAFS